VKVNWSADPQQYSIGLLGFGKIDINGAAKSTTFSRLARDPQAGDTYLELSAPVGGWRGGETLYLPDTRQVLPHMSDVFDSGAMTVYPEAWEEVRIASVAGNRSSVPRRCCAGVTISSAEQSAISAISAVARICGGNASPGR